MSRAYDPSGGEPVALGKCRQARGSEGVLVVKRWLARERGWTKE